MVTELLRSRPAPAAGAGDVLPNYWNPSRGEPDIVLPSAATYGVALVFGVGAWGAWLQVEPAAHPNYVLISLDLMKLITASCSFWVEVAVLIAQEYVVVGRVGQHVLIVDSGAYPLINQTYRLAPCLLPAGSRVSVRGWTTAGHVASRLNLSCVLPSPGATWHDPWPNTYIGGARATSVERIPAVPGWLAVAGGGVAWTEVVAAAASDMLFTAAEYDPLAGVGGASGNRVEIGVGAAGAEVVFSRVALPGAALVGWPFGYHEVGRKSLILAGERVAARLVGAAVGGGRMGFYFEDLVP